MTAKFIFVFCLFVVLVLQKHNASAACAIEPDPETGHVDIPTSWTTVAASAFSGCQSLRTVFIPNTVTSIQYEAFKVCSNLVSLTIPASVISIGERAFASSASISSLTLEEGSQLQTIEHDAFSGCTAMAGNLFLPRTITSVGVGAFYLCRLLTISFSCGTTATFSVQDPFYGTNGCTACNPTLVIPTTVTYAGPRTPLDCTCPAGSYSATGQQSCTACSTGYTTIGTSTVGTTESACSLCARGHYSSTGNASGAGTGCTACPAGYSTSDATSVVNFSAYTGSNISESPITIGTDNFRFEGICTLTAASAVDRQIFSQDRSGVGTNMFMVMSLSDNFIGVFGLGVPEYPPGGSCAGKPAVSSGYCTVLYTPVPLVRNIASIVTFTRVGLLLTLCVDSNCSSYTTSSVSNKPWTGLNVRFGSRYPSGSASSASEPFPGTITSASYSVLPSTGTGTGAAGGDQSVCIMCAPGFAGASVSGLSGCTACPQGKYGSATAGNGNTCTSCGVGYSTATAGTAGANASACTSCAAGYEGTSLSGTSGCSACPQGKYGSATAGNGNTCATCNSGYTTLGTGTSGSDQSVCTMCAPGFEGSSVSGTSGCTAWPQYIVSHTSDTLSGSCAGSSTTCNLRACLSAISSSSASGGSCILVAGTHTFTQGRIDITGTNYVDKTINIASRPGLGAADVVIDGTSNSGGNGRFLRVNEATVTLLISDVTIQRFSSSETALTGEGVGVTVISARYVIIDSVIFKSNTAPSCSAFSAYVRFTEGVLVENSKFDGNTMTTTNTVNAQCNKHGALCIWDNVKNESVNAKPYYIEHNDFTNNVGCGTGKNGAAVHLGNNMGGNCYAASGMMCYDNGLDVSLPCLSWVCLQSGFTRTVFPAIPAFVSCPLNSYSTIAFPMAIADCTPCAAGYGIAEVGATGTDASTCASCAAGYEGTSISGLSGCAACPQGKYGSATAGNGNACTSCGVGYSTASAGAAGANASACTICAAGFTGLTSDANNTRCYPCKSNTYKATVGNGGCSVCPANTINSLDHTYCEPNFVPQWDVDAAVNFQMSASSTFDVANQVLIVGVSSENTAYIYDLGTMSTTPVLTIAKPAIAGFGTRVAITEKHAVVTGTATTPTRISIFDKSRIGQWSATPELTFDVSYAHFHTHLAENVMAICARYENKFFIYPRSAQGWSSTAEVTYTGVSGDQLGNTCGCTSNYAITGSFGQKKAYIFSRSNSGWSATPTIIDGASFGGNFGHGVAISNTFVFVGAYWGVQKVYIYKRNSETAWDTSPTLTIDGYTSAPNFGAEFGKVTNRLMYTTTGANDEIFGGYTFVMTPSGWNKISPYSQGSLSTFVSHQTTNSHVAKAGANNAITVTPAMCAAGHYSSTGNASGPDRGCNACNAGTYSSAGETVCTACSAGKYTTAGAGSTSEADCNVCAEGFHGDGVTCTACSVGYTTAGAGSTSVTACNVCAEGFHGDGVTCTACSVGYTTAGAGSTSVTACNVCAAGYGLADGSCVHPACAAGSYHVPGDAVCTPCPVGYSTFAAGTVGISSLACDLCAAGYSGDVIFGGSSGCTICPAGKSTDFSGATFCEDCWEGTYAPAGSPGCITCDAGKYSKTKATACLPCPAGHYSHRGQPCARCSPGTYSALGESACTVCPAGTFCTAANTQSLQCSPGSYSDMGASKCRLCPGGMYSPAAGASGCIACPRGETSSDGATACNACNA